MFHHAEYLSSRLRINSNLIKTVSAKDNRYLLESKDFMISFTLDKSLSDYCSHFKNENITVSDCMLTSWIGRCHSETVLSSESVPVTVLFHLLKDY